MTTDEPDNALPPEYRPDGVERIGRRLKMEYVGMASVFVVIWLAAFRVLPHAYQSAIATAATFFLFLALKKKTRDHLVTSFLMFAAAWIAAPAVTAWDWAVPYAAFAACAWALEGYLEKRRGRIHALPLILAAFAWTGPFWILGAAFVAAYLLVPLDDAPDLRRKLAVIVAFSGVAAVSVALLRQAQGGAASLVRHPPDAWLLVAYAALAIPTVLCLVVCWKRLARAHRVNGALFTLLAPLDERAVALFGVAATIVLAATVFRQSADSARWRPAFKHAEWYFFWVVFAAALALLSGLRG